MAVYFPNTNSLLLLPPKTGSTWLRAALEEANVFHILLGPEQLRGHGRLALYGREFKFIGAFVRHPISWYHSYWRYRNSNSSWDARWIIDSDCRSSDFDQFLALACSLHPGYITNLFSEFTGSPDKPIDYIGKSECLAQGLLEFLQKLGEKFDPVAIECLSPKNVSGPMYHPSDEICDLVFSAETGCYKRYGYNPRP